MKDKLSPEAILSDVLNISDSEEQGAYLDEICSGDEALRAEVESLLRAHLEAEGFLEDLTFLDLGSAVAEGEGDSPPTAEELAGDFPELEILELIGKGGMGAVFKARQGSLDRLVALKVLPMGWNNSGKFSERFECEAKILAGLNHPGIVTIHDFGERNGRYFFTMEFVDGTDLERMIRGGDLEPDLALKLISQICEAIQFAHDRGVVHRDIKPGNILLSRDGRIKVADFGIAKLGSNSEGEMSSEDGGSLVEGLTSPDGIVGTPRYMAPEQASASTIVDHRADLYALGIVFYEMLVGSPPPEGALPALQGKLDRRWNSIIRRALAKDPAQRFQNASEIRTAVEGVLEKKKSLIPGWLKGAAMVAVVATGVIFWPKATSVDDGPLVNSLEMSFVPVPGVEGLVSQWETRVRDYQVFVEETGRKWPSPAFEQTPNHPAVNVSWHDAQAFCHWLTKREHASGLLPKDEFYRLPTDLEWSAMIHLTDEKGIDPGERHLGQKTTYPWGEEALVPEGGGNYPDASGNAELGTPAIPEYDDGFSATAPVGEFEATKEGLHDLGGNVWEWTSNFMSETNDHPALRGGGWHTSEADDGWKSLLGSYRRSDVEATASGEWDVGFRMVRGPVPSEEAPPNLFRQIANGDLDGVVESIAGGADVQVPSGAGLPPIVLAADAGELEIVKVLREHGASLSASDRRGRTALHAAAELGDPKMVAWLLEEGADPRSRSITLKEPMQFAVRRSPVELLELLLEATDRKSLTRRDKNGDSAMIEACHFAPDETLHWLIRKLDSSQIAEAGSERVATWLGSLIKRDIALFQGLLVKTIDYVDDSGAAFALTSAVQFDREEHYAMFKKALGKDAVSSELLAQVGVMAVRCGRPWAVKDFMANGGELERLGFLKGRSALHVAARDNRVTMKQVNELSQALNLPFQEKRAQKYFNSELAQIPEPETRGTIQVLVEAGMDLEARDGMMATPLISAAMNGNLVAVEELLRLGAKIETKDGAGFTPLLCGVEKGHLGIVKELEKRGADFSAKTGEDAGVLHVVGRNEEILRYLLEKGLPLEEKQQNGYTPLGILAFNGDEGVIGLLVKAGANVNASTGSKGRGGSTPLHRACLVPPQSALEQRLKKVEDMGWESKRAPSRADREERIRAIKLLVDHGADPMALEVNRATPLHYAAQSGLFEAVDYFLKKGANPNALTREGMSPVHFAAGEGNLECLKTLVAADAELDLPFLTPLMIAAVSSGSLEVVNYLIEKKVPLESRALLTKHYPIHQAAGEGKVEILKALLNAGANIEARDVMARSPLHLAAREGHREVVDLLILRGARKKARDFELMTPAGYAFRAGHKAIENILNQ